jgi:dienelactone hydrolase
MIVSSSKPFNPQHYRDYTVTDPEFLDAGFPPEQFVTYFKSGGATVHAMMWTANGPELKPCVVLSPQIFGGDRLESLIVPLLSSGISVCTFHPRGMWDRQHEFSFVTALDDLLAAAEFMRTVDSSDRRTLRGNPYRIDPERVVVAGLSGGGGSLSLAACAEDPGIVGAIAVAPGNYELYREPGSIAAGREFYDYISKLSDGRIDVEKWLVKLSPADFDRISPIAQAKRLLNKKVLLIGGDRDITTPIEHCHRPIAAAIRSAGVREFTEVILEADHSFLTKRIALSRLIISWLQSECGF